MPPSATDLDKCVDERSADQTAFVRPAGIARRANGARDGNAELASAYSEYRSAVHRFLVRRTGDVNLAEDLMQEVFLNVATYVAGHEGTGLTPSLLFAVARRRLADEFRPAELRERETALIALPPAEAQETTFAMGLSASLTAAIQGLSPSQQRVFVMRFLHGMAYREIASRLHSTEEACKVACSRARRTVADHLEQVGVAADGRA